MITRKRKSVHLIIAAVLIAGLAAWAQAPNSGRGVEGAWNVSVAFDRPGLPPCAPAPATLIAATPGQGSIVAESCWASEGAGHGAWARTAHNQYAITFKGNSFAPNGTVAASYTVRAWVSLDGWSETFSGPFQTQIFDLSGNLLDTLTGRVNAVRIGLEP